MLCARATVISAANPGQAHLKESLSRSVVLLLDKRLQALCSWDLNVDS